MPGNSTARPAEKRELQASFMHSQYFADERVYNCSMTTLSSFISRNELDKVNLLKIDVEGMELEVMKGASEQHWSRIEQVVAEVHNVEEEGVSRLDSACRLLRDQGFTVSCAPSKHLPSSAFTLYATKRSC